MNIARIRKLKMRGRHVVLLSPFGLVCSLLLAVLIAGCGGENEFDTAIAASRDSTEVIQAVSAEFQTAMSYLDNLHQFQTNQASERIVYHLQRWVNSQDPDPDWIAEPLYSRLPERFQRLQSPKVLSNLQFRPFDVSVLREAIWMRDLALQIQQADIRDSRLAAWVESQLGQLEDREFEDLRSGVAICDWIVRNIQLDDVHSVAAAKVKAKAKAQADSVDDGDAKEGETEESVLRDGADLLPWEALLLGHGDWIVRNRIATLMSRQLGINVVTLGIEGDDEDRPWCLGIKVGEQLYLYDMQLGLPVFGDGSNGPATLAQLVNQPELLKQLDDPEGKSYRISAEDLKNVVALIEAAPESLSQRMKVIESKLTSKRKMVLTCTPSLMKQELTQCEGITNVRLWSIPYDAYLQRTLMMQNRSLAPYLQKVQMELSLVDSQTPLASGRRQHFRGVYSDTDNARGAKSFYMESRVSDARIDRPRTPAELEKFLGLPGKLPDDPQLVNQLVKAARKGLRLTKRYASYWLGLIALDEGKYESAQNYFSKRLLDLDDQGAWSQGARYNLGRTYEQLGLLNEDETTLEKAKAFYLAEPNSAQAAGNRIRAGRL